MNSDIQSIKNQDFNGIFSVFSKIFYAIGISNYRASKLNTDFYCEESTVTRLHVLIK